MKKLLSKLAVCLIATALVLSPLVGARQAKKADAATKRTAVVTSLLTNKGKINAADWTVVGDKNNIDVETFDNAKRQIPGTKAGVAKETFRDLRCTLTEEQIKTEAKRCLGCGASVVDENKCIGCGICTTKCEFDAIHLTRDLPDASRMWKSEDKLKAIAPYALKRQFAIKRNKN